MLRRLLRCLVIAYAVYLGLALLVLLPALNIAAPRLAETFLNRELDSELILFNPFTLALEVRKARLTEPGGGPFAALELLRVDFGGSRSLVRPGFVLDGVVVDGLELALRRYEDGSLNIGDLIATDEDEPESEPGTVPGITVRSLAFNARELRFEDHTRTPSYETLLQEIDFAVTGLSTIFEEGSPYELLIVTEENGILRWQGEFSVPRATSSGNLQIADLDLRPFHRYLAQDLPFALDSALMEVVTGYEASWGDGVRFSIDADGVQLRELAIRPRDPEALPDTHLDLQRLEIDGIAADSEARSVGIARVRVEGLDVAGYLEDELLSLQAMLVPEAASGNAAAEDDADDPPSTPGEAGEPWSLKVDRIAVAAARGALRTPYTTPALTTVAPLDLALTTLTYPAGSDSNVDLSLTVNGETRLTVDGTVNAISGDGRLAYDLATLPLAMANPLIGTFVNAGVESGTLSASGEAALAAFEPATVTAETRLPDFTLRIRGREERALGWEELAVPGIRVDLRERRLETGVISLTGYQSRVHILEDGSLNVQLALKEDAGAGAAPDGDTEDGGSEATGDGWAVSLAGVALSDATIDFEDDSLPLRFRTLIEDIGGEVGTLSTESTARVPVELAGSVDGYAPVRISGAAAPFAPAPDLDIGVSFQGLDIARLSPYAGTYAGYTIDAGTLNLDLRYVLEGDRLQGENRAVISQMKLGAPYDSERAVELPLQLAIALLTDSRGVIDLDVPVEGDIDDPSFRLGKVIGRAITNVIVNVATAPFKLLAGIVGSDEDLQQVAFAPGSTRLDAPAAGKLESLADALEKRPQLRLLALGATDDEDRMALRERALRESLLATGLSEAEIDARGEPWADAIAARYAPLALDPTGGDGEAPPPTPEEQYAAVLETVSVSREELERLATDRAAEVKRYLVTSGEVAADRVTIAGDSDPGSARGVSLDVDA